MSTISLLVLLGGLMALSAIISASETAYFSLRPWRVERLRRERSAQGGLIAESLRDPRVFVVSVIVGTELVNVAASNLVAILMRRHATGDLPQGLVMAAGAALTSAVIVLVCDLAPKFLGVAFPEAVALRTSRPLSLFFLMVRPLALPLARLTGALTETRRQRASARSGPTPLSEEDFRALVEISRTEGVLKPGQVEMIEAAFRLGDLHVRQLMVPRPDIIGLRENATREEALSLIRESRHSRIPLYREGLDEITGVLYAKDLLALRAGLLSADTLRDIARPPLFVPEVMRASRLINEFQARKVHIAIVVDEYGGTAGVVSLEDLLEEMMGEFSDEFDRPLRVFRRVRRGVFWVRASMPLPEFNRKVRARIKDPEVDTIGGYVLRLFGRVPAEGDSVSDDQFTFTVRRMRRRRILVLLVQRRGPRQQPTDAETHEGPATGAPARRRA